MGCCKELQAAFKPDLFVNHYGSSEVYTCTIDQNAPAKPGSAGRAGINQMVRVVKLAAQSVDDMAAVGEEGEIIALLAGDEFVRGLLAAAGSRRQGAAAGLVFHRRYRLCRCRWRYLRHRPGRRHDHHRRRERFAGRDRILPFAPRCGIRGRGGRAAGRALGQGGGGLHQAPCGGRTPKSSTRSAARRDLPTSSVRAATSSSPTYRNRRSASCCAANLPPANMTLSPPRLARSNKDPPHEPFFRSAFADSRRLPRRDRCRTRTCRRDSRPAAAQCHRNGRARSASPRFRSAR